MPCLRTKPAGQGDLYRTGSTIARISIARAIRVLDPIQSLDCYSLEMVLESVTLQIREKQLL